MFDRHEWEFRVRRNLVHPDAIKCVTLNSVLDAWWQAGFSAHRVANELNKRYLNRKTIEDNQHRAQIS